MEPKLEKKEIKTMGEGVELCNKIYKNENIQLLDVYDRYTILNKDKVHSYNDFAG